MRALIRELPIAGEEGHARHVYNLAFHPDGTRLAGSGYHEVLIWSVPDGRLLARITNVAERVHALAFQPDGRRIAVAAGTPGVLGEVKLFDVEDGRLVADLGVADDAFFSVAFNADGSRLIGSGPRHRQQQSCEYRHHKCVAAWLHGASRRGGSGI